MRKIISVVLCVSIICSTMLMSGCDIFDILKDKFLWDTDDTVNDVSDFNESTTVAPPEEPETAVQVSLEDEFQKYIAETLVPKYGVMDTKVLIKEAELNTHSRANEWKDELNGLLSANVNDFDDDGQEELLAISYNSIMQNEYGEKWIKTNLKLEVFEYDFDSNSVKQSAQKDIPLNTRWGNLNGFIEESTCFSYQYRGKTYMVINTVHSFNHWDNFVDIFRYNGNTLDFIKGIGQDGGCYSDIYETDKEPANLTYADYTSTDWNTVKRYSPDEPESDYDDREFNKTYEDLMLSQGLICGFEECTCKTTKECYKASEGDITWLAGINNTHEYSVEFEINTVCLFRKDYEGTLDAYRNGSTVETTTQPEVTTTVPTTEATTKKSGVNKADIYDAYLKQIKSTKNLWYYTLYDMDDNGIPELILHTGTCEADSEIHFYTFNKGILYCGNISGWHSGLYSCNEKALLHYMGNMDYGSLGYVELKNANFITERFLLDGKRYAELDNLVEDYKGVPVKEHEPKDFSGLNILKS